MPTGGPGVPQKLSPPETRANKMWHNMWWQIVVYSPKKLRTARQYSTATATKHRRR